MFNVQLSEMEADMLQKHHLRPPLVFVERTVALIKPDAVDAAEEIEELIVQSGFTILQKRRVVLSAEQCTELYFKYSGQDFFPSLKDFMSSGPIVALALARNQAIATWKVMMGPTNSVKAKETHPECLRAKYGTSDLKNAVHGSESFSAAEKELRLMFPNCAIEPIPTDEAAKHYLGKYIYPILLRGLTELCKTKPVDALTWLADWLVNNNPNKPKEYYGSSS